VLKLPENINEQENEDVVVEEEITEDKASDKKKKKEKKSKELEKIEKLEAQIKALQAEANEWKNEYLKAHAETENFKRRTNEQAVKDRKYASQKVVGN